MILRYRLSEKLDLQLFLCYSHALLIYLVEMGISRRYLMNSSSATPCKLAISVFRTLVIDQKN